MQTIKINVYKPHPDWSVGYASLLFLDLSCSAKGAQPKVKIFAPQTQGRGVPGPVYCKTLYNLSYLGYTHSLPNKKYTLEKKINSVKKRALINTHDEWSPTIILFDVAIFRFIQTLHLLHIFCIYYLYISVCTCTYLTYIALLCMYYNIFPTLIAHFLSRPRLVAEFKVHKILPPSLPTLSEGLMGNLRICPKPPKTTGGCAHVSVVFDVCVVCHQCCVCLVGTRPHSVGPRVVCVLLDCFVLEALHPVSQASYTHSINMKLTPHLQQVWPQRQVDLMGGWRW